MKMRPSRTPPSALFKPLLLFLSFGQEEEKEEEEEEEEGDIIYAAIDTLYDIYTNIFPTRSWRRGWGRGGGGRRDERKKKDWCRVYIW